VPRLDSLGARPVDRPLGTFVQTAGGTGSENEPVSLSLQHRHERHRLDSEGSKDLEIARSFELRMLIGEPRSYQRRDDFEEVAIRGARPRLAQLPSEEVRQRTVLNPALFPN